MYPTVKLVCIDTDVFFLFFFSLNKDQNQMISNQTWIDFC